MPSSRRRMMAGLVMGLSAVMSAAGAEAETEGVTLWLSLPSPEGPVSVDAERLTQSAIEALRPLVKGSVVAATVPAPTQALDDLRRLPTYLADLATEDSTRFPTRYVICTRLAAPNADTVTGELALVDRRERALLGFRSVALTGVAVEEELSAAMADLVGDVLPAVPLARVVKSAPLSERAESTVATVVRDAPAGAEPQAMVPHRPAPVRRNPQQATNDPLDAVLRQYASGAMAMGGMGRATDRPRVLEATYQLLLLPRGASTNADAKPVRAELTVWSVGRDARIEADFSRPVRAQVAGRRGNWVTADLEGYQVEREHVVEVGRSGLVSLHVKPTEGGGGTRLGFQLTTAGAMDIAPTDDGCSLVAEVRQDAERMEEAARSAAGQWVNPDAPVPPDARVVRTFTGVASWYGGGGVTATGERYNQWGWTAAHRTLPFGTWIRVTYAPTGRSAVLRVNDRGPFIRGRVLDVTKGCAQALGFYGRGVAPLTIEVLDRDG